LGSWRDEDGHDTIDLTNLVPQLEAIFASSHHFGFYEMTEERPLTVAFSVNRDSGHHRIRRERVGEESSRERLGVSGPSLRN
jgi:hypothetical protein